MPSRYRDLDIYLQQGGWRRELPRDPQSWIWGVGNLWSSPAGSHGRNGRGSDPIGCTSGSSPSPARSSWSPWLLHTIKPKHFELCTFFQPKFCAENISADGKIGFLNQKKYSFENIFTIDPRVRLWEIQTISFQSCLTVAKYKVSLFFSQISEWNSFDTLGKGWG